MHDRQKEGGSVQGVADEMFSLYIDTKNCQRTSSPSPNLCPPLTLL